MTGTNPVTVSVVVVNYNREKLLRRCLRSLERQTFRDFEIIVVDNNSSDSSPDYLRSLHRNVVDKTVFLERNTGFTGGCNRGIKLASGRYIALINNDAEAEPDWLSALLRTAEKDLGAGMWASKILFHGTDVIDKAGHLIFPDGQNRGRGTGERDKGQYQAEEEALFPDGCAALYRRELLEQTGGFDEDFFAYADDADLGLRARWLGWSCVYVPDAVVYHRHSSTTGSFDPKKIYWVERNRIWLAVKNLPLPLLLLSPMFTAYRFGWNLKAALFRRGSAGSFREKHSWRIVIGVLVRANWAGWADIFSQLRKRKKIMGTRNILTMEFLRTIFRFRISARRLTMEGRS
jgi:GT2 family glycosyltransferase